MKDNGFDFGKPSKEEVESNLTQLKAIKILLKNNRLGCEVHIAGMHMGICNNEWLISVIEKQEQEIKKYLKGKPNLWE